MVKATDGTALNRLRKRGYKPPTGKMYGCHCETLIQMTLVCPIWRSLQNKIKKKKSNLKMVVLCRLTNLERRGQCVLNVHYYKQ